MIKDIELNELSQAKKIIKAKNNILILNPQKPDGDSIGSAIALWHAFKKINKKIDLYCPDLIPEKFDYLVGIEHFQKSLDLKKYELLISVDFAELEGFKISKAELKSQNLFLINIDHHITNTHFGDLNVIDPSSAACCEIIYFLIKELEIKIDPDIATALLTGLSTDTGSFQHSNTTSRVLNIASILLSHGAKLKKISSEVYNTKSIPALKLWGLALRRLQFDNIRKISYSIITQEDFKTLNATLTDLEGAVTLLSNVPGSKITILFSEYDGKIKGSLRTENDNIDVSCLASFLGGGGHKKASGFTLDGKIIKLNKNWKILLK